MKLSVVIAYRVWKSLPRDIFNYCNQTFFSRGAFWKYLLVMEIMGNKIEKFKGYPYQIVKNFNNKAQHMVKLIKLVN